MTMPVDAPSNAIDVHGFSVRMPNNDILGNIINRTMSPDALWMLSNVYLQGDSTQHLDAAMKKLYFDMIHKYKSTHPKDQECIKFPEWRMRITHMKVVKYLTPPQVFVHKLALYIFKTILNDIESSKEEQDELMAEANIKLSKDEPGYNDVKNDIKEGRIPMFRADKNSNYGVNVRLDEEEKRPLEGVEGEEIDYDAVIDDRYDVHDYSFIEAEEEDEMYRITVFNQISEFMFYYYDSHRSSGMSEAKVKTFLRFIHDVSKVRQKYEASQDEIQRIEEADYKVNMTPAFERIMVEFNDGLVSRSVKKKLRMNAIHVFCLKQNAPWTTVMNVRKTALHKASPDEMQKKIGFKFRTLILLFHPDKIDRHASKELIDRVEECVIILKQARDDSNDFFMKLVERKRKAKESRDFDGQKHRDLTTDDASYLFDLNLDKRSSFGDVLALKKDELLNELKRDGIRTVSKHIEWKYRQLSKVIRSHKKIKERPSRLAVFDRMLQDSMNSALAWALHEFDKM
jgi:hypothetical protein